MRRFLLPVMFLALSGPAWSVEVDVVITDYNGPQSGDKVAPLGKQKTNVASIFAAKGEYECFSFMLQPKDTLPEVMIKSGALAGPGGATIPAANVVVQCCEGGFGENRALGALGKAWNMEGWAREYFWVTVKVPDDAAPGAYKGDVVVTSQGNPVAKAGIVLDVLPFALEEPPYMIGWHYAWPTVKEEAASSTDKASLELLRKTLKDMREHGCTNVGPLYGFHMPVTDDDTTQVGIFVDEYIKAGYTKPLMFAAAMGAQSQVTSYGPIESKRFQQKYIEVMRKLHAEMKKHPIPVIFSIGDEFTNRGMRGVEYGEKLAKLTHEELPELVITSDADGYTEVMKMAPWMNFATFNNGWDGADHHNKGRTMLNDKFLKELTSTTDAIPYFVNTGKGRMPFGFFFWKMTKYGVRGKVEWFYNLNGKGNNEGSMVTLMEDGGIRPTINYERSREGIDDVKYASMLERLIADAKKSGKAKAEAAAAEAYLKALEDSIIPNWTAYSKGGQTWPVDGQAQVDPEKAAALGSLNAIRRGIADHIVAIQKAMK
ncbi:MAG: hypothetical protein ACE15C_11195 [Phycisphaerae bacterium]